MTSSFKTGVIGTVVTAICCFTPVLAVTLGLIGLGTVTGYLDYALIPALAAFMGITLYAVVRRRRGACDDTCAPAGQPQYRPTNVIQREQEKESTMTQHSQSNVRIATAADFRSLVLASRTPVVVDFWAPWCVWCKKLAPIYEGLSTTMDGITFVTVNVDEERTLAQEYGVSSLPTLKFFCGGREIAELIGALPKDKLEAKVREILDTHTECLAISSPLKPR